MVYCLWPSILTHMPRPVHHEVTKRTKTTKNFLCKKRFVLFVALRVFVMSHWGLLACVLFLCVRGAAAETIDRVLALVAGQLITLTDVTAARDLGLVQAPADGDPVRAVLSTLIDRELILTEVDRYAPPEPSAAAVDREVERVRARFPSPQTFAATLARSGIDEKHLRETVRADLRIRAYLDQRFTLQGREESRQALVDEWLAGLRRRADIIDLYLPER